MPFIHTSSRRFIIVSCLCFCTYLLFLELSLSYYCQYYLLFHNFFFWLLWTFFLELRFYQKQFLYLWDRNKVHVHSILPSQTARPHFMGLHLLPHSVTPSQTAKLLFLTALDFFLDLRFYQKQFRYLWNRNKVYVHSILPSQTARPHSVGLHLLPHSVIPTNPDLPHFGVKLLTNKDPNHYSVVNLTNLQS